MRFLKIFLICWFAFVAVFFLLTVMLNVFVGIDLSAYCTALMGITGIEAMASGVIEVVKIRAEAAVRKEEKENADSSDADRGCASEV